MWFTALLFCQIDRLICLFDRYSVFLTVLSTGTLSYFYFEQNNGHPDRVRDILPLFRFWQINDYVGMIGVKMSYELDKATVTMSNALIRSGQNLSLAEKRLVSIALSKLDTKGGPGRYGMGFEITCKITAEEYAELAQCDTSIAYRDLKRASKSLHKQIIEFYEPDHKRKGKPLLIRTTINWIGYSQYHLKEGWAELTWNHKLVPHLLGLKREFTTYQLSQAAALRSVYSHRLLELLMMFEATGWAKFNLEDFCKAMDATPKQRADFANVRRRIIEPAIKELQEKDGWKIEWVAEKTGRKVTGLNFTFERDKQDKLF